MTEQDWLTSNDPVLLMCGLRDRISTRKYRLFEIAYTRHLAASLHNDAIDRRISLEELLVEEEEDEVSDEEIDRLNDEISNRASVEWRLAEEEFARVGDPTAPTVLASMHRALATGQAGALSGSMEWWYWLQELERTEHPQSPQQLSDNLLLDTYVENLPLLRCIVGNPFRPVPVDPSWLSSTVFALAEGIYSDRAFDPLAILADALEDAGCDNADILAHCRGTGPHARGCWVVDLVLGKE